MEVDVAVLGCGWAGVLASGRLASSHSVVCLDKAERLGGLLRSEETDGFTVDIGGSHVLFSRDRELLEKILGLLRDNVIAHERRSHVLLGGTLVPYPLENGLHALPPEVRAEALSSYVEALLSMNKGWRPKNFEEWIYGFFGGWFAKNYLVPYNRKLWKRPLSDIDVDWVYTPGRLPIPDWRSVVRSAVGIPTQGYLEQARFHYPLRGGIQALYDAALRSSVERGTRFLAGRAIRTVRAVGGEVLVNGTVRAKRVVSTIPIPDLVASLDDRAYSDLSSYLKHFDYNRVVVVAVALDASAPPQHWVYVPDERIVFHRYAWLSNYSPNNAPPGKSLLVAEITVPPGDRVKTEGLIERTLRDLERLGVADRGRVIFARAWTNEHGYPIHKVGLAVARDHVTRYLRSMGIETLGRWGTWRYLNIDAVAKDVERLEL